MSYLIFGKSGWIANQLFDILKENPQVRVKFSNYRLHDRHNITREIEEFKPTHVLNAAGVTGRPNIDWCEDNRLKVIKSNVLGCLTLADICHERDIHMTYFGTGCIYESRYDEKGDVIDAFKEEDEPNFDRSYYSKTKIMVEKLLDEYPNVLTLRIRMPIVKDMNHSRNFIHKITQYEKVVNIPNSMTVLPELLPLSIEMANRKITGKFNFTNPGVVSHNEILEMYKRNVDPSFTWTNFSLEEQAKVIKAPRSNNCLDTRKLESLFPHVLPIRASLETYIYKGN